MRRPSHDDEDLRSAAEGHRERGGSERPDRRFEVANALFEHADEVALMLEMNGNPLWVSPNVWRLFDASPEELTASIGIDLVHPDDRQRVAQDLARLAEPGVVLQAEYRVEIGGSVRWIHITLQSRVDEQGRPTLLGNLREISRQRDVEVAVSLEAALLAPANQAITALAPDGTINYWNDSATSIYGWTADEAVGKHHSELIPVAEGSEEAARAAMLDNAATRSWTREMEVVRKDGSTVPIRATATPLLDENGNHVVTAVVAYDTTEIRRSQEIAARLAAIVETSRDAIFSTDLDGRISTWNAAATNLFGIDETAAVGSEARMLVEPDHRLEFAELFLSANRGERADSVIALRRPSDGSTLHVSVSLSSMTTSEGLAVGMSVIARDVTARHQAELALAHQATHDPLSGLANRRLLVQRMEESLDRSRRHDRRTGIVYIDLDDFKHVNDVFGHGGGDRVLHDVGQRIAATVGDSDTVARLGGDEYVVACDGIDGIDQLTRIASRVRRSLSFPFRADRESVTITASIGIALSGNGAPAEVLLRNADIAMYAAKEAGGNRVELFDDALYAQTRRRNEVKAEIEAGLEDGQFHTYFQPEVSLGDGSLFGFEALVRWIHPSRGIVSPADFIPLAEQSGSIIRLGQQVLRDTCDALRTWSARVPSNVARSLMTSVNLSPIQVSDPGLRDMVQEVIEDSGVQPEQLCLEVTESALMDFDLAAKTMGSLKDLGVSIAIDDFGTGYSSLSRLKLFPVDFLKIDKSFIDGLGRELEDDAIVSAMIGLSHSLGVDVIAEGIETEAQLSRLREFGCRYGQGYLWSRPIPTDEATSIAMNPGPLPQGVR